MTNASHQKLPHIIYILSDDQRADMWGLGGHPVLKTPHLDALAQEGCYFPEARCTSALCTPSRACHYTGRWERAHGVNFNSPWALSSTAWEKTFLGHLKAAGYWTAWVGKNHVPVGTGGYQSGYLEQWFDYWYGNHNHSGFYPAQLAGEAGDQYARSSYRTQPEVFGEGALTALRQRNTHQPLCMCVTFNAPHESATGSMRLQAHDPERYRTLYRDQMDALPLPVTYQPWKASHVKLPREVYNGIALPGYDYVKTPQFLRETITRQAQLIHGIDQCIGDLRAELENQGIADNTIIVYSTDHGILFGEHGLGGKALLYEPALKIPMIIYDPRAKAQGACHQMVAVPDLAPTIMDLCGLQPEPAMQGRSLATLVRGETDHTPWRRNCLFVENIFDKQNYPRCNGVIVDKMKYIQYFPRQELPTHALLHLRDTADDYDTSRFKSQASLHEELFDLSADPDEKNNLVAHPEYQQRLADLRDACRYEAMTLQHADDAALRTRK